MTCHLAPSGQGWPSFVHLGVSPSARWSWSGRGAVLRGLPQVGRCPTSSPFIPSARSPAPTTWLGCQARLVLWEPEPLLGAKSGRCLPAGVHLALELEQVDSGGGPAPGSRTWDSVPSLEQRQTAAAESWPGGAACPGRKATPSAEQPQDPFPTLK